jgi:hypothetical protein
VNTNIISVIAATVAVAAFGVNRLASTQSRIDEISAQIGQLRQEIDRLAEPDAGMTAVADETMNYLFAEVSELRRAIHERAAAPAATDDLTAAAPSPQAANDSRTPAAPADQAAADPVPLSDALRTLRSRMLVTPNDWEEIDASVVAMSREENREFWHQLGEALADGDIQLLDAQAHQPR